MPVKNLLLRKNSKILLLLVLLFLLSSFLRLYNIKHVLVFGADEQYQATYALTLVKDFHPIWIGVNAAHTGFYLGPLWTYFTAFLLFLSKGDPLFTGYIAVLLGVITTLTIFFVAKDIFNSKVAFLSSFLYATLPLMVYYDQKYWNPSLTPLLSVLLFYSLYKIFENPRWIIAVAFIFGLVFHVHLSLIPLGIIASLVVLKRIKKIGLKLILLALLTFLIVYSPLIVFDVNHQWSNLKTPFRVRQITGYDKTSKVDSDFHLRSLSDTFGRIWYLKQNVSSSDEVLTACGQLAIKGSTVISERTTASVLTTLISVFSIILFAVNKQVKLREKSLLLGFIGLLAGSFVFFPGGAFEYYLLGMFPLILLVFSANITYKILPLRYLIYLIACFFMIAGITTVVRNSHQFGLNTKRVLIEEVSDFLGESKFELFESGGCHAYEGWRHLFATYGVTPSRSSAIDANLGWLYPNEIYRGDLDYKVIMQEERIPYSTSEGFVKKFENDGFAAYIYKW